MSRRAGSTGARTGRHAAPRGTGQTRLRAANEIFAKSLGMDRRSLGGVLDELREAAVIIGPDQRIAFANRAAARFFRCQSQEMAGQHVTKFFESGLEPDAAAHDGRTAPASHALKISVLPGVNAGGRRRRLKAMASRIEIGGTPHLLLTIEDSRHDRRMRDRLRAARTLFSKIVELSDDAIISVDANGSITLFSSGAERMFGYDAREALGRRLEILMPKRLRSMHRNAFEAFKHGDTGIRRMGERGEILAARKGGEEFPAEASIMRFELGGQTVLTAILRDITERKRKEAALKESERLFRAIFDQTFQYIGLLRPDGIVIEVNRTALEFGGLNRTDVVGRPFMDTRWWVLPLEVRQRLRHALSRAAAGEFVRYETEVRGAGDLIRIIDFSLKPVFDDRGQVALLIVEGRDISEKVEADAALRLSEARLANAQRIAKLGNWDWKLATNDLYWSEEVYRIFGIHRGTFGATYHAFLNSVHPDDRDTVMRAVDDALHRDVKYSIDHRVLRPDGTEATVHEEGEVIRDSSGQPIHMTGTVQDITDRKQEEEVLRLAKQHAELANRAKSEFLANMSHELRTPLNAIIGFSEIMMRESLGPLNTATYGHYVGDIWNAGKHLLGVISDVLDVSKIEAGSLKLNESEIDIVAAVSACIQMVKDRAAAAGLHLSTDIERDLPQLNGDERLLKQMVLNLLSNAIKFTLRGRVNLIAQLDESGGIVISVSDTGIGIAPEDIPKALEPFGQVDTALNRKFGGTGLGLALTRSMVELHGGGLTLDSKPEVGTRVSLRFPRSRTVAHTTVPGERQSLA